MKSKTLTRANEINKEIKLYTEIVKKIRAHNTNREAASVWLDHDVIHNNMHDLLDCFGDILSNHQKELDEL